MSSNPALGGPTLFPVSNTEYSSFFSRILIQKKIQSLLSVFTHCLITD